MTHSAGRGAIGDVCSDGFMAYEQRTSAVKHTIRGVALRITLRVTVIPEPHRPSQQLLAFEQNLSTCIRRQLSPGIHIGILRLDYLFRAVLFGAVSPRIQRANDSC